MSTVRRSLFVNLSIVLGAMLLALLLTWFTPLATGSPFLLFIVAILFGTRLAGWRAGMLVMLGALGASIVFFRAAVGDFDRASFLLVALLVIVLVARDQRAQKKSAQTQSLNAALDRRAAHHTLELQNANRQLEAEIAEHQRSTEQLRLLAAHLQSAREEERIHIAREIHDEIGTLMTAVKMDLAYLDRTLNGNDARPRATAHEDIAATTKLVDDAIEAVHHIARELRPGILDHLGLRAALEWQLQEFQERAKITCQFDSDLEELDLDPARATAVFRIMQEALTNVARHAHATRVAASLHQHDRDLILRVRDNGVGFGETPATQRLGILGMRERAHVFGGEVTIHSAPGQGTLVTVRIPVSPVKVRR